MTLDRATVVSALRVDDVPVRDPHTIRKRWTKREDPTHERKFRMARGRFGSYCNTCVKDRKRNLNKARVKTPSTLRKMYGWIKRAKGYGRSIRRIDCTLTFEEFAWIRSGPCVYCGGDLPLHGTGLDRVDPGRGYELGNVVPACTRCNHARGAFITFDEFTLIMHMRRDRMGPGVDLWSEHLDRGGLIESRRQP